MGFVIIFDGKVIYSVCILGYEENGVRKIFGVNLYVFNFVNFYKMYSLFSFYGFLKI